MSIQNKQQPSAAFNPLVRLNTSLNEGRLAKILNALPHFFRHKILEFDQIRGLSSRSIRRSAEKILTFGPPPELHQGVRLVASKNLPFFEQDQKDVAGGNSGPIKDISPLMGTVRPCLDEEQLAQLIKKEYDSQEELKRAVCDFCTRCKEMGVSEIRKINCSAIKHAMLEPIPDSTAKETLIKKTHLTQLIIEVLFSFPHSQRPLVRKLLESRCAELSSNPKKIIAEILVSEPNLIKTWSDYVSNTFANRTAKLCPSTNDEVMAEQGQNFGIQYLEDLIEIAKFCTQKDGWVVAEQIQDFGIQDQKTLFKLARLCIQGYGGMIAQYIENFGIEDPRIRIQIAKLCAQKDGLKTARHIRNFDIQEQQVLFEIAMICAKQDGKGTATYIENFGIQAPEARIAIANLCAKQNSDGTAQQFENFGIQDQEACIAIATICAQQDGEGTARYIQNFGIQAPDARIAIAKFCAKQNSRATARELDNFKIQDQQVLTDIAEICAEQNGKATAQYIQNFGIKDENARIQIAKHCAKQGGGATAQYIEDFSIEKEGDRIQIAELCAQQDGKGTAQYIQNFKIQSPETRIELAKLCAKESGEGTAREIKNFDIKDQQALSDIAEICAKQNGKATAQYIQNFDIKDEKACIQIAKLCAQQDGEGTAQCIQNFDIKDEKACIQIAELCAQQNGEGTAQYIQNFDIKDEKACTQIAELCAQQNGEGTAHHIENFGILDPQALFKIRSACLFQLYASHSVEGFNMYAERLLAPYREEPLPPGASDPFELITIRTDRERAQLFFLYLHQREHFRKHKKQLPLQENDILTQISKYRNRALATHLGFCFQKILSDPLALDKYSKACGKQLNKAPLTYLRLPLLLLSQWGSGAEDMKSIREFIQLNKTAFKNAGNRILQAWLLTSSALDRSSLSSPRRLKLLEQACASLNPTNPLQDLCFRLSTISALIDFGQQDQCDRDFSADMTQELSTLLEKGLKSSYPFLGQLEDISENYLNTLGSMRIPLAWVTYLRGLGSLNDPEVEQEAKEMVCSIIQGTHLTERARTDKSRHLEVIANNHPILFEAWQIPPCSEPYIPSVQDGSSLSFDFTKFLREKFADGHFKGAEALFSPLKEFVETGLQEAEVDHEAIKICIALCQNAQGIEKQLQQLQSALAELPTTEFHRDIEDLLKSLRENKKEDPLELVDTNHWHDLILSGTEVLGSCQRVDGSPHLNKCLLSYVMDGKIRMVCLRDKGSGKVLARGLFKLLLTETSHRPVLFLDRIYPPACPSEWKDALVNFAKKRAKALSCQLTMHERERGTGQFPEKVVSLGSRSPYEYEDGAGGVETKGIFTISKKVELIES